VGDTVYIAGRTFRSNEDYEQGRFEEKGVFPGKVTGIAVKNQGVTYRLDTKFGEMDFEPSYVHLTQEAAEAALRSDVVRAGDVRLELTWDEEAARAALMETENEKRKEGVST
jgi:hypothetical protein